MSRNIYKKADTQPSRQLVEEVWSQFDTDALVRLCEADGRDGFADYATRVDLPGFERFYWYRDNGARVLAVAHLDAVQDDHGCQVTDTAAGPLATCGALDDRLGVYVILDLLPRLGVTCDWLLTTDEEMGRSTARDFAEDFIDADGAPGKVYDWIIQFDRGGDDVVMYQYETDQYARMVEQAGAQVGIGSYSDIADLDELGCAAFNWGVGYQDYHSARSHAWLADTFKSVARFLQFYDAWNGTHLPHEPARANQWPDELWGCDDPVEADCGHLVDLADERTYGEWGTGRFVLCTDCYDNYTADTDTEPAF